MDCRERQRPFVGTALRTTRVSERQTEVSSTHGSAHMVVTKNKALAALAALAAATTMMSGGCATAPTARVSDPAVYTMTHVVAAANAAGSETSNGSVAQLDLQRY